MMLQAGAAKLDITPKAPCHLAGYGCRAHAHDGVHDPISLRALFVRGQEGDGVLITADILGFADDSVARVRAALQAELGLRPECVLLVGTHTHSAPAPYEGLASEGGNPEWVGMLERQAVAAAALAATRLREVTLRVARGSCNIGVNRREQRPDGSVVLGRNPEGPIDRELILVAFDAPDGTSVARLCNFACHGVVLDYDNFQISGDWPGVSATTLEGKTAGAPFLFLNGGAGNVNPRIGPQPSFEPLQEIADEFCGAVDETSKSLAPIGDDATVRGKSDTIRLPRKQAAVEAGKGKTSRLQVHGLRIGELRIAGFPGEVFSETLMAVKQGSPHPLTMAATYTCGHGGGYVPVAEAYESGGYEVAVSAYAEGAEKILRQAYLTLLKGL